MVSDHKPKKTPQGIVTAAEPTFTKTPQGIVTTDTEPDTQAISKLLKAVYRSGATGTPRNLKNDVAALTALYGYRH